MSVVLGDDGRAVIHNRQTGQEMSCSVPTAIENVANSGGIWAHGHRPADLREKPVPAPVAEPAIPLTEPDVLPLPAAEAEQPVDPLAGAPDDTRAAIEGRLRPVADDHVHVPAHDEAPVVHPLDHDADGKKGGSKPRKPADPERAAVIADLKAAGVKFFAGSSTEKLKALLPA